MLRIFTDRSFIPKDMDFIFNVESSFDIDGVLKPSEFTDKVLGFVEEGRYLDSDSFIDRFGYKLNISELSTTSKILFLAKEYPNKCINAIELGKAGHALLPLLDNACLYVGNGWNYLAEILCSTKTQHELNGEVRIW